MTYHDGHRDGWGDNALNYAPKFRRGDTCIVDHSGWPARNQEYAAGYLDGYAGRDKRPPKDPA